MIKLEDRPKLIQALGISTLTEYEISITDSTGADIKRVVEIDESWTDERKDEVIKAALDEMLKDRREIEYD